MKNLNISEIKKSIDKNAHTSFLMQPHILKALLGVRTTLTEISVAAGLPIDAVQSACQAWKIDEVELHQRAIDLAILLNTTNDDPDISPYETAVIFGCKKLGWCPDKFLNTYKVFRYNRKKSTNENICRPKSYKRSMQDNECQLNLMEFFMLWIEHGRDSYLHHGRRRRATDRDKSSSLQIARKDHYSPYTFDNCFVSTQNENMQEMHQREKPGLVSKNCPIIVNGVRFRSRSEALKILGKSECWLGTNEGNYSKQIFRLDEAYEILFDFIRDPDVEPVD